jgi:serine/threonine-protein kinase
VLLIAVQLAILAVAVVEVHRLTTKSATVTTPLPRLVGHDRAVADGIVRADRLRVRWTTVAGGHPGSVVRQVPLPGAKVSKGQTVTLTVARGPGPSRLPDVTGFSVGKAQATLQRAGLRAQRRQAPSQTIGAGLVASTSPPPFAVVSRGARVVLVASTGAPRIAVPKVQGALLPAAERRLMQAGLTFVVANQQARQKPGTVLGQTPRAGARVRRGTVAHLLVATSIPVVAIPGVTGERAERAATAISSLGLAVTFTHRPVDKASQIGLVLAQTPVHGRKVARGSKVMLTLGIQRPSPPIGGHRHP